MALFRLKRARRFLDDLNPADASTSVLESGARFQGRIRTPADARVAGRIEGSIEAGGRIHVAASGVVEGALAASDAKVDGVVQGPVRVQGRLEIGGSGRVTGDVRATRLDVADGAEVRGELVVSGPTGRFAERRA